MCIPNSELPFILSTMIHNMIHNEPQIMIRLLIFSYRTVNIRTRENDLSIQDTADFVSASIQIVQSVLPIYTILKWTRRLGHTACN